MCNTCIGGDTPIQQGQQLLSHCGYWGSNPYKMPQLRRCLLLLSILSVVIRHLGPTYITFVYWALAPLNKRCSQHYGIIFVHESENCILVQSHQFVAELHQNAPNRVLNLKKIPGSNPGPPYTGGSDPTPPGRGKEGKWRGRREIEEERGGREEKG